MITESYNKQRFRTTYISHVDLPFDLTLENIFYRLQIVFVGHVVCIQYRCFTKGENYNKILVESEGEDLTAAVVGLYKELQKTKKKQLPQKE